MIDFNAAGTVNQPDGGPAACAAQVLHLLGTQAYFADRVDWPTTTVQVDCPATRS